MHNLCDDNPRHSSLSGSVDSIETQIRPTDVQVRIRNDYFNWEIPWQVSLAQAVN